MMDLSQVLKRYRDEIEAELKSLITDISTPLSYMMRYHLGWIDEQGEQRLVSEGKMLRPTLCLLACEAVDGDWRGALPAAAAVELVHNFSLAHDDIEDESTERRGRPTLWHIWGQPQAINAGDAMLVLSHLALFKLVERGAKLEKSLQAIRLMDETCLRLCEGQHLDLCYENRLDVDLNGYLQMIEGKTAALLDCSLRLGALLGTDDQRMVEGLGQFGHKLGLAFQIRDDILGIWGQESITGKTAVDDIQRRKKSLPIVYGLAHSEELMGIYGKETLSQDDILRVLSILKELHARDYAQGAAQRFYQQGLGGLESIPISPQAKEELKTIAVFLIEREY
jgi:geranylgeranyl diphosphate synthase type I